MQTTITIDDALYEKALEMADSSMDKSDIFREALKTFVRVQTAKRLAALGGTTSEIQDVPRRRAEPASPVLDDLKMRIFRLIESYEFFLEQSADKRLIRVEVLEATNDNQLFRARVWLQNTYNLYPTFLNLGASGEDLKQVHSSDQISTEISTLIADEPEWLTGIRCKNAKEFLDSILTRVIAHLE
jgi:Arc/MetJ family transcription regulator